MSAHQRAKFVFSHYEGYMKDLPYEAVVTVHFTDGSTISQTQDGLYNGASFTSLDSYWTEVESDVASCTSTLSTSVQATKFKLNQEESERSVEHYDAVLHQWVAATNFSAMDIAEASTEPLPVSAGAR